MMVPCLDGPNPRHFFERTPFGVPNAAGVSALGLARAADMNLVPGALAWDVGGPLALLARAFALYGWIAVRRARER